MRLDQLEHVIRAAGKLLGDDTVVVVGSQAILASVTAPADEALTRSMEADVLPRDDTDGSKADLIDAVLGLGSNFDDLHGIHADGVGERTAKLPEGWRDRLIPLATPNTNGITGLCLEANDLVVSKLAASRQKDLEFCRAALRLGYASFDVVLERLDHVAIDPIRRESIGKMVRAWQ